MCSSEFRKEKKKMRLQQRKQLVAYGFAGRAAAVHPGTLGLDVVLLPLAEVADEPPLAAAGFADYTFFLETRHQDARKKHQLNCDNGRHHLCILSIS
jgi:hypothetical protein